MYQSLLKRIDLKNKNQLSSLKQTTIIDDNSQLYNLSKFIYLINEKEFKKYYNKFKAVEMSLGGQQ